jgi:hypothetical protein
MGSVGKGIEKFGQGVGSTLGINAPTKLGRGGAFAMTPEAAAAEKESLQRLRDVAAGKAPSVTELQYKQAMDDITRQQQSAAASARGVSSAGLLQRQAMLGGQEAGQQLAQQSAVAKLAEQRSAEQMLLGQAAAQRGIAAGAAGTQLGAEQDAAKTRAGFFASLGGAATSAGTGKYAGGEVEGEEVVPGDSPLNDTEPHMLSAGEIVIPKSAAKDKESAVKFLEALKFDSESRKKSQDKPKSEESYVEQEQDYSKYAKGMATLLEAMAQLHNKK